MAKDPAFLFYPNDWIGGTMGMSLEDKGAYMEVLMMQFNVGHMTSHMIGQVVGQKWDNIKHKFRMDSEGKYYNERLELEKEKRKTFTKSRQNNITGKNQYSKNKNLLGHMDGHTTSHMENENENVNEDKNIDKDVNKNSFNKKPFASDFNGLPELKINMAIEFVYITKRHKILNTDVLGLWEVFKIQNLNGENFYQSKDKVYSHFINWIKTQNFNDAKPSNSSQAKQDGFIEYHNRYSDNSGQ
jgi:hypothetical protein